MNLRCKNCQKIFIVNDFTEVRIIQALQCLDIYGGIGHVLSELV